MFSSKIFISQHRKLIDRGLNCLTKTLKRECHYRSQHLLATLSLKDPSSNAQEQRNCLYNLVQYIEKYPEERHQLIKDGAIRLLERLRDKSQDNFIVENTKLGLALLGHPPPLPSNGIRILSIDGGGIRGLMVMELLLKLEKLTGKKLFELFDMCVGVSTGAILVAALAAERNMTVQEGILLYKKIGKQLFYQPSAFDVLSNTSRLMWSHAYYDTELWEKMLKKHVGYRRIIDTVKLPHCPKICCISTTVTEQRIDAHCFRNYVFPPNIQSIYNGSHKAKLWEVVRASSAAPAYFGDFVLNNEIHQDGGVLFNNPTAVAIHEAKLIWPDEEIQCVVSFGTGRNPNKSRNSDGRKMINPEMLHETAPETLSSWKTKFLRILDSATDTEATHVILSDLLPNETYYRFNPYLEQWIAMVDARPEKITQLENDAHMYYRKNEDKFEQVAANLTQKRDLFRHIRDTFKYYSR
ncbi:calcium-independent phospholipase A2-gamma-like [Culicoides brevitarsis]|uniref:calcium-independent phospholipase A2-gamma-like n=1 Tax=Culicoides brevitarsis TaxID=469753 RepID=UPI00307C4BCA